MSRFREHALHTNFSITLTRAQLQVLTSFLPSRGVFNIPAHSWQTYHALMQKGVLERVDEEWKLTKEGALLLALLRETDCLPPPTLRRADLPTRESILRSLK